MPDGSLVLIEKEVEIFKKELDDKLKLDGKLEFKSSKTFDRLKFREDVDLAQAKLEEYNLKCKEFETQLNILKNENVAELKLNDKQFLYRKNQTTKKLKDFTKKIDKQKEKFKKDLEKLEKVEKDENKKNLKIATSVENLNKKEEEKKPIEELNKPPAKILESEDEEEDEYDSDENEDEDITHSPKKEVKGLQTLILDHKAKVTKQEEVDDVADIEEDNGESHKQAGLTDLVSKLKPKPDAIVSRPNSSKTLQNVDTSTPALSALVDSINKEKALKIKENVEELGETIKTDDKLIKNYTSQMNEDEDVSVEEVSDDEDSELSQSKTKNEPSSNKDEEESDVSVDENEEHLEQGTQWLAIEDFEAEQEGDLTFVKGDELMLVTVSDENWFIMKDKQGREGQAPRDYVKFYAKKKPNKGESVDSSRSNELWKNLKDSAKLKKLIDPNELKAVGLVPESFAQSNLSVLSKDPTYSYVRHLAPKLSDSNLIFKNLFYDSNEQQTRSKSVSFQKLIMINKCTNIPTPNKDEIQVLNRYVRICLFDKQSILSNIHTICASTNGKDENTWLYENHVNELSHVAKCSELFIRYNLPSSEQKNPNLGILFELSMHCIKKKTNEETHISCGWAHLLFKDSQNNVIANKSYDLLLNGGAIFDKPGQSLNPNVSRKKTNKTVFGNLIDNVFRESKIKFSVNTPNTQMTKILNSCVEPLIGSTLVAPFIKYYYDEIVHELLRPMCEADTQEFDTSPIHSPFLASFPLALTHSDLVNYVKIIFEEKKSSMKRDERNDERHVRKMFIDLFNKIAYPILHMTDFNFDYYDAELIKIRDETMEKHYQAVHKNNIFKSLTSDDEDFLPFDTQELSYQFLS